MPDSDKRENSILAAHVAQLRENFDTVQIFVTRHDGTKGTFYACKGSGNWYARTGYVQAWLDKCNEQERMEVRPEDDDA